MGSFAYLCGEKQQFDSKKAAREAAKRLSRKSGRSITAYRCPWCAMMHVGKQDSREH